MNRGSTVLDDNVKNKWQWGLFSKKVGDTKIGEFSERLMCQVRHDACLVENDVAC